MVRIRVATTCSLLLLVITGGAETGLSGRSGSERSVSGSYTHHVQRRSWVPGGAVSCSPRDESRPNWGFIPAETQVQNSFGTAGDNGTAGGTLKTSQY